MKELIIRWRKYSLFERLFSLYIILLPVMKIDGLPVVGSKIQLSEIVFIPLFFAWVLEFVKQRKIALPEVSFLLLGIILISLVSLIKTINLQKGILELLGLFYLSILFFLIVNFCNSEKRINIFLNSWMIGVGIVVICGLTGLLLTYIFHIENPFNLYYPGLNVHRLISTFRNPNMLASYLLISTVFISAYAFNLNGRKYIGLFFIFVLFFISLFTVSRVITGIIFCLTLILNQIELKHILLKRITVFGLTLMFVVLMTGIVITSQWIIFPIKFSLSDAHPYLKLNLAPSAYKVMNNASISIISQHPFTGAGIGSHGYWLERFPEWTNGASRDPSGIYHGWGQKMDIHNTYLGWGAEIGLIGLCFILAFFLTIVWKVWKFYKTSENKKLKQLSYFVLLGMIGMMISGFTLNILTLRHFWALIGFTVSLYVLKKYNEDFINLA